MEIGKDGELLHIPTKVVQRDGKYFAVINSLHNSIYSVIENQGAFSDVTGHWAQSSIENLASRLIVNGNEEGQFQANRTISRAEFISILVRALGIHESDKTANFIDVSDNDWYYDTVNIGVEYGLIQGYEKGEFRPDNQVTKQEAMVMLTKALKLAGKDVSISAEQIDIALSSLQDREQLASWAREAAAMNLQEEIVNGYQGKLAPRSNITRAETVKMIEQLLIKADLI
ncbi:Endo-1,4-beta-xylanase A precursor [compost metagenome]